MKNIFKKNLSLLLCGVLFAAMTLTMTGCGDKTVAESTVSEEANLVSYTFEVVDADGNVTTFDLATSEETVGAALLAEGLIAGDDSEYGLYVKTVNGITVDYDTDGKYWAFYIDGEYASTGVDSTPVTEGSTYSFKVE